MEFGAFIRAIRESYKKREGLKLQNQAEFIRELINETSCCEQKATENSATDDTIKQWMKGKNLGSLRDFYSSGSAYNSDCFTECKCQEKTDPSIKLKTDPCGSIV